MNPGNCRAVPCLYIDVQFLLRSSYNVTQEAVSLTTLLLRHVKRHAQCLHQQATLSIRRRRRLHIDMATRNQLGRVHLVDN